MEDRHEATGHRGGAVPPRDHPVLTRWAEDERPEDPTTWTDARVRRVVDALLDTRSEATARGTLDATLDELFFVAPLGTSRPGHPVPTHPEALAELLIDPQAGLQDGPNHGSWDGLEHDLGPSSEAHTGVERDLDGGLEAVALALPGRPRAWAIARRLDEWLDPREDAGLHAACVAAGLDPEAVRREVVTTCAELEQRPDDALRRLQAILTHPALEAARLERPETRSQLGTGEAPTCRDLAAELRDGIGRAPDGVTRDAVDATLRARPGRFRGLRLRGRGGSRGARDAGART